MLNTFDPSVSRAARNHVHDLNILTEQWSDSLTFCPHCLQVGSLVDCCAASAGLASGVSFQTWSNARTDVKKSRPDRKGRVKLRARAESMERAHLNAYIRDLKSSLEGPKGGSVQKDRWVTGKMTIPKRWEQYADHRRKLGLPVIGSKSLFVKVWKDHKEIVEISAKGHATCDKCVSSSREASYASRMFQPAT